MARQEQSGILTPTDAWVLVLAIGGMALFILQLGRATVSPLESASGTAMLFGALYMLTGFLFCAAVPSPVTHPSVWLSRFALWLFHLLPRPRPWVRAAVIVLCVLPFLAAFLLPSLGPSPTMALAACVCASAVFFSSVVLTPQTKAAATDWDAVEPWCLGVIALFYCLAEMDAQPLDWRLAASGYTAVWFAQLVFLRQATARHWATLATIVRASPDQHPPALAALAEYAARLQEPELPPAPAPKPGEGPVHVDAGSFRVDPSKMLEKLSEHQLVDANDFILAFVRCAVASSASYIVVEHGWTSLRLRFDGRPFSEHELRDPYRALLDSEAEEAARGAQLAYGFLAVLRLNPEAVWVQSGPPQSRVRLSLSPRETTVQPGWISADTEIFIAFGLSGLWKAPRACRRAQSGVGLCPAQVTVDGAGVTDFITAKGFAPTGWSSYKHGGWTIAWKPRSGEVASRVRVYHLGAFVEEFEQPIAGIPQQVDAALTHPDLRLSISQGSVVRDPLFNAGLKNLQALRAPR